MQDVDVDRLFQFKDCPRLPQGMEEPAKRDEFYRGYRERCGRRRNPQMFAVANRATRVCFDSCGDVQSKEGFDSFEDLRTWVKWLCFLGVSAKTLDPPVTVTRGLCGLPDTIVDKHKSRMVGDILFWAAPSSTTDDASISEAYCNQHAPRKNNVLVTISGVSQAFPMFHLSSYPKEREWLLPPFCKLQVERVFGAEPLQVHCRFVGCVLGGDLREKILRDFQESSDILSSVLEKELRTHSEVVGMQEKLAEAENVAQGELAAARRKPATVHEAQEVREGLQVKIDTIMELQASILRGFREGTDVRSRVQEEMRSALAATQQRLTEDAEKHALVVMRQLQQELAVAPAWSRGGGARGPTSRGAPWMTARAVASVTRAAVSAWKAAVTIGRLGRAVERLGRARGRWAARADRHLLGLAQGSTTRAAWSAWRMSTVEARHRYCVSSRLRRLGDLTVTADSMDAVWCRIAFQVWKAFLAALRSRHRSVGFFSGMADARLLQADAALLVAHRDSLRFAALAAWRHAAAEWRRRRSALLADARLRQADAALRAAHRDSLRLAALAAWRRGALQRRHAEEVGHWLSRAQARLESAGRALALSAPRPGAGGPGPPGARGLHAEFVNAAELQGETLWGRAAKACTGAPHQPQCDALEFSYGLPLSTLDQYHREIRSLSGEQRGFLGGVMQCTGAAAIISDSGIPVNAKFVASSGVHQTVAHAERYVGLVALSACYRVGQAISDHFSFAEEGKRWSPREDATVLSFAGVPSHLGLDAALEQARPGPPAGGRAAPAADRAAREAPPAPVAREAPPASVARTAPTKSLAPAAAVAPAAPGAAAPAPAPAPPAQREALAAAAAPAAPAARAAIPAPAARAAPAQREAPAGLRAAEEEVPNAMVEKALEDERADSAPVLAAAQAARAGFRVCPETGPALAAAAVLAVPCVAASDLGSDLDDEWADGLASRRRLAATLDDAQALAVSSAERLVGELAARRRGEPRPFAAFAVAAFACDILVVLEGGPSGTGLGGAVASELLRAQLGCARPFFDVHSLHYKTKDFPGSGRRYGKSMLKSIVYREMKHKPEQVRERSPRIAFCSTYVDYATISKGVRGLSSATAAGKKMYDARQIHEMDEKFDAHVAELRLEQLKMEVSVEKARLLCWSSVNAKPLDEDNMSQELPPIPSPLVTAAQLDAKLITMECTLKKAIASAAGSASSAVSADCAEIWIRGLTRKLLDRDFVNNCELLKAGAGKCWEMTRAIFDEHGKWKESIRLGSYPHTGTLHLTSSDDEEIFDLVKLPFGSSTGGGHCAITFIVMPDAKMFEIPEALLNAFPVLVQSKFDKAPA
ncbi:unnamed protein product [Prorocentrum cordatum]|uniref:NAD(+)--protein-arginine ADP-ribosyltransferase n=1 Tax=Prorocentrum cordatum TaxID=2364126 RepID=A0ABN9QKK3_9DINO|nr:unnamed protein product [Polarella glacialis]